MDVFEFADFPFVTGASKYVENLDFRLDELFHDKVFGQVRERGKERVLEAIKGEITWNQVPDRTGAEKELLSYPVARILVSCLDDKFLVRRYALAEAKSSRDKVNKLREDQFKELISDLNITARINDRSVVVHFSDYIRYSVNEPKWKMVNRKMDSGWVHLTKDELTRIIEEAVRKRIELSLPLDVPPGICTALESYLVDIREALSSRRSEFNIEEFKEIIPEGFPPCIAHALSNVQSGINLTHSMRFAFTSFLLNINMDIEGIIDLFRVSPDFDEERTRYQVMHIHGSSGTTYKAPSCSTMVTYGNCYGRDSLCDRISHPLNYYKRKVWLSQKQKKADKGKKDNE